MLLIVSHTDTTGLSLLRPYNYEDMLQPICTIMTQVFWTIASSYSFKQTAQIPIVFNGWKRDYV